MATWAEVSTWTNSDIVVEIQKLLPEEWVFEHQLEPTGAFSARVVEMSMGYVQWQDEQADERLLLLNAYGWLFTRKPTARHPAWIRGESNVVPVTKQMLPVVEDPEDLNPSEIESVYGKPESK